MVFPRTILDLSGDRIIVEYHFTGNDEVEAWTKSEGFCLEQTVETTLNLLADDPMRAGAAK
jgi:hypothetical protein